MRPHSRHHTLIVQACRCIEQSDPPPSLEALAQSAGMSPHYFQRIFKSALGISPKAYAQACRARRLELELAVSSSVTQAIFGAGFGAGSRFYENSARRLGMTPRRWINGGQGETIVFALGQCQLGALLVAATSKGLCAVWLGNDPDVLLAQFTSQFHRAHLVAGSDEFDGMVARVAGSIEQTTFSSGYPLDIRGTVFQEKVWRVLAQIPLGTTVSYAELASLAESPSSVRAVASACGANNLAYLIPCHRVVRTGGELGGYRWGLDRKAALLAKEESQMSPQKIPELPTKKHQAV